MRQCTLISFTLFINQFLSNFGKFDRKSFECWQFSFLIKHIPVVSLKKLISFLIVDVYFRIQEKIVQFSRKCRTDGRLSEPRIGQDKAFGKLLYEHLTSLILQVLIIFLNFKFIGMKYCF